MGLNRAYLVGSLGRDPENKALPNGTTVCTFSLATSEKYKSGDEWKERTDWHNIVIYGKLAEISASSLQKGSKCFIEGRISTRSWDDKTTGKKVYRTEIIAEKVEFMAGASGGAPREERQPAPKNDEDIPF